MVKNLLSTEEKIDLVKWYLEAKNDKNVKNLSKKTLNQNIIQKSLQRKKQF
jgi:hypothetical protein